MIPTQVASPASGAAPVFSPIHRIGTGLTEEDLFVGYTPYLHG
jgi:hypothetical protein